MGDRHAEQHRTCGLILIAVVVLVLFGRGKIASLMGEVGKGITSFKRGVRDGQNEAASDDTTEPGDSATARDVSPENERS